MRDDLAHGALAQAPKLANLAGLITSIVGAVSLVLLIVLAIWIAVGAVRFGIEVAAPYR